MASTLYLTIGSEGRIWNGRPNVNDPKPQLYLENTDPGNSLYAMAANNIMNFTTFTVVVVSGLGRVLVSERVGNQISTWNHTYTASGPLYGVAYSEDTGVWIAVGPDNRVIYSDNDPNIWEERTGAIPGCQWNHVCYGAGTFVACGGYTTPDGGQVGAIMYSVDYGQTWIKGDPGTKNNLYSISYSPELKLFVAVGANGTIVSLDA